MAADAAASAAYSGPSLVSGHCTSQDIKIATADVTEYSFDGTTYIPFNPATPVSCQENTPIFLRIVAHVKETATSERTDVGVWVSQDGGNARTGVCNHYNLAPAPAFLNPPIENANHVWNIDNDQCGDMNQAGESLLELGVIDAVCQTGSATSSLLHVGSCLGWTQPGGDQVCPTVAGPTGFRLGTTPGTSSKCNCEGFDVPIVVNKVAKLEIVKACTPSTDPGTFDLLIDGSTSVGTPPVVVGDNKACGGSTGAQTLGAGSNITPGAVHTFGEGDFTTANYTSSYACVNRGTTTSRGSGTSLGPNNITLQPNDDVVCTYTNVRKPEVKLVKALNPTTDAGKFDLTLAGTTYDNAGAGFGNGGNTGFQIVAAGTVAMSEAAHTGTTLADYTSALACVNAANGAVTVSPNNNTSGSITVAAGDKITCTITNTRKPRLKVVKATVPTTDAGKFDFTIGANSFNNSGAGYGNGEGTAFQTLNIGNVNISEAAHTGTTLGDYTSALACSYAGGAPVTLGANTNTAGTVPLAAGDQITCTFTNTRGAVLKVVKSTLPTTDPGKFDFTIAGTTFNNSGAGYGNAENTGFKPVPTGSVSISEAAHTGTTLSDYTSTLACVNAAAQSVTVNPNGGTSGTLTTVEGDQITCTFTNTRKPEVKLVKVLDPPGDAGKFDLTLAGTTYDNAGVGFGNGGNTGFQKVAIGTVAMSEAAHAGTTLSDYTSALACVNAANGDVTVSPNNNTSGSITVAAGDKITCTITNTRKPRLKVVKATVPTTDAGKFDFTIGGTGFNNAGAGYGNGEGTAFQTLGIGNVAISEVGHTGTTLTNYTSALACVNAANQAVTVNPNGGTSGTVALAAGDQITCTFTNTRKPQVKLVKDLVPNADAGRFDLTIAGTTFNNGGGGFGDLENTGFQTVTAGSVAISETGHGATTLSEYTSTLACVNASNQAVTVSPNNKTSGTITTAAGDQITCTFTNNHVPKLSITKTPDPNTAGYAVSPGGTATFTVTVANASDAGAANDVVLTDTLPAGVGDWSENPDKTQCTIAAFPGATDPKRLLVCNVGTLLAGGSFTVVVQATVPSNFLLQPPSASGTPIEIDGNLVDDAAAGKDWGTPGLISCTGTILGCDIDLPTGTSDNSFGQGTKEDSPVPSVVTGSIPNNKSDLLRFYVANERFVTTDYLYLAWERVQAPNGTTNMDFELNQSSTLSSNGVTPVRTAGDILIKYDLSQGGTNPVLGYHRWVTSGNAGALCEASNKLPCWSKVTPLTSDVAAAINTSSVTDPISPNAPRTLDALTFGEARINLQAAGIFQAGVCLNFGQAYLKSRSSDAFAAEIKDFIAPIPISVSNCAPKNLDNKAWVKASNFAPLGGNLGDPISDTGQIHVADAAGAGSSMLNSPTGLRLAQVQTTTSVAIGGLVGDEAVTTGKRGPISGARQRAGTPWPPDAASVPRPRLLA
jgi:uncharacterized repeat protein (TIGR01451 family)